MKRKFKKVICGATAAVMLLAAGPMASAATPFTDVPGSAWYASFVDYAYNHGLMAGTSATAFSPEQTMTRGMLVTVLHSIAGRPAHSGRNPFSDVGSTWYTDAVLWCYENGIVAGTSASSFSPNSPVTREQMVAILFKFARANGLNTDARADLSGYGDYGRIESYARDAFSWAVASGVISGTGNNSISPKGQATRAQCATILQRYHELMTAAPTQPTEPETQPTEPEPQPTEPEPRPTEPSHIHTWEYHYDAPGHWGERHLKCDLCGWTVLESEVEPGHLNLAMQEHLISEHGLTDVRQTPYPDCPDFFWGDTWPILHQWIPDAEPHEYWQCTDCGEISETAPCEHELDGYAPENERIQGESILISPMNGGVECTCGWYPTYKDSAYDGDLVDDWGYNHCDLDPNGPLHSYHNSESLLVTVQPKDTWKCSKCGAMVTLPYMSVHEWHPMDSSMYSVWMVPGKKPDWGTVRIREYGKEHHFELVEHKRHEYETTAGTYTVWDDVWECKDCGLRSVLTQDLAPGESYQELRYCDPSEYNLWECAGCGALTFEEPVVIDGHPNSSCRTPCP